MKILDDPEFIDHNGEIYDFPVKSRHPRSNSLSKTNVSSKNIQLPSHGLDLFFPEQQPLMVFLWFSFCFLRFEIPRKQKENKKKTQENPRKPEEKKTTAPPSLARSRGARRGKIP